MNRLRSRAATVGWMRAWSCSCQCRLRCVPHATNYLINAAHPQAQTHLSETLEPFWFDKRYLR